MYLQQYDATQQRVGATGLWDMGRHAVLRLFRYYPLKYRLHIQRYARCWWGSWLMVRGISGVARVQRSCEAFGEAHCACCSSTISNGQLKVIGDAGLHAEGQKSSRGG